MFRFSLPAVFFAIATGMDAQTLSLPGLSPQQDTPAPACDNLPNSQDNCVRVLACMGDQGVYFDGQARGWDTGGIIGTLSNGATCAGSWTSDGWGGTGLAQMACGNGLTADVIYYSQDGETGTTIGHGRDSLGRSLRVWSGTNVLAFLTKDGTASLPCGSGPIPIS